MQPDPAVGVGLQDFGGFFRLLQIAHHDGRSADAEFPLFADGNLFGCSDADHLGQHVRKRNTHAAFPVAVNRRGHDRGDGLGEAVSFHQLNAAVLSFDDFFKPFLDGPGQRVGSGGCIFKAAQIGGLKHFVFGEGVVKRRHPDNDVGAFLPDQVGDDLRRELGDENAFAAAHESGVAADAQAEAVEDGQDGQNG